MASISDAVSHQTSGIGYAADLWSPSQLDPGTRLYKMMPSGGPYYFNYEAYRQFAENPESMYGGLQVRVSKRHPMRVVVVEYEVIRALRCPTATCEANGQFGCGGAQQYFITEGERDSHLYQSSPGWGLDGKGIGYF